VFEPKSGTFLRGARGDLLILACGVFFHPLFLVGSKKHSTQNDRSGQFALVQTFLYGLIKRF